MHCYQAKRAIVDEIAVEADAHPEIPLHLDALGKQQLPEVAKFLHVYASPSLKPPPLRPVFYAPLQCDSSGDRVSVSVTLQFKGPLLTNILHPTTLLVQTRNEVFSAGHEALHQTITIDACVQLRFSSQNRCYLLGQPGGDKFREQ